MVLLKSVCSFFYSLSIADVTEAILKIVSNVSNSRLIDFYHAEKLVPVQGFGHKRSLKIQGQFDIT